MSPTELLKDAEADLAALAGLPGEIHAKVKAGVAELTRIRDAVEALVAGMTTSARDMLAALEARAAAEVVPAPQPPDESSAAGPTG